MIVFQLIDVLIPKFTGDSATLSIFVKDPTGNPMPETELTVWLVDKAVLDLAPLPLPNLLQKFSVDYLKKDFFSITDNRNQLQSGIR